MNPACGGGLRRYTLGNHQLRSGIREVTCLLIPGPVLFPPFLSLSGPFLLSQLPGRSSQEQADKVGLWGDTELCPLFSPSALAPFLWQTALGLLGCCISEKRSSLAKQIQLRRKATPCKIAPGPQRRVFLVFSLTFSTGLKPRMCPVFSSLVPPHHPPHPWCLQFPEC